MFAIYLQKSALISLRTIPPNFLCKLRFTEITGKLPVNSKIPFAGKCLYQRTGMPLRLIGKVRTKRATHHYQCDDRLDRITLLELVHVLLRVLGFLHVLPNAQEVVEGDLGDLYA